MCQGKEQLGAEAEGSCYLFQEGVLSFLVLKLALGFQDAQLGILGTREAKCKPSFLGLFLHRTVGVRKDSCWLRRGSDPKPYVFRPYSLAEDGVRMGHRA